ncbi:hypothetical protein AUC43_08165 [Hymenobacter sedentarius]|uniref:Uncharacterized protein n=1 Tax=Hymenobacter sedentarius TaxID=1411621 RepID=A0A0U4BES1_9BACT|nr:hypothetical protein [Hymenobacter sedentarius]ALW85067.1 hypothetical protein AUC43_08165 [Hymenobacter sedentarius]
MLRTLLALLLLANYLLVVGAGLVVGRPAAPAFSAAHPYVHSQNCQQQNYLRLDCFEQCNGHQQAVKTKVPTGTGLHFLAQLKGLDVHCALAQEVQHPQRVFPPAGAGQPVEKGAVLVAGFAGRDYPPPRWG